MATYEVEHSLPSHPPPSQSHPVRPDLSTFFTALSHADTTQTSNPQSVPTPVTITAVYRQLADALNTMVRDGAENDGNELLERMISTLRDTAEVPPQKVTGVSQEFLDTLERVPLKSLKKRKKEDAICPICSVPFLEDPYPLVVRLPCHTSHVFDLECVGPWLRINGTCPMDRKEVGRKKEVVQENEEDEDGEWDDYYA